MDLKRLIGGMTLEEKCAQVVFPAMTFQAPDFDGISALVRAGVGGICVYMGSIFELPGWINSMQQLAKLPLLFSSDFEEGAGQQVQGATVLPPLMAVAATDSEELAELHGRICAVEGRALGIPWNYAPVVDCQNNPLNPIINTRAFGEKPELVIRMARAFLRGTRKGGGLSCLKHFPGHGDVTTDSHIELPTIPHDRTRIEQVELRPFRELAPMADAIMTGHLLVPAFDDQPVTVSAAWHEFIRREMKFDGLITTDALIMGGIANTYTESDTIERALAAGADILLFPQDPFAAIEHIHRLVKDGRLSEQRLDQSIERIFRAKEKVGLFGDKLAKVELVEQMVGNRVQQESARRIAEASMTLVRDDRRLLPLHTNRVAYVCVVDESCRDAEDTFAAELQKDVRLDPGADVTIVSVMFKPRALHGKTQLDDAQVRTVKEVLQRTPNTVVVSFGSPYVVRQFPEVPACVCAYSDAPVCQTAAAHALLGKIPFKGRLPVTLG